MSTGKSTPGRFSVQDVPAGPGVYVFRNAAGDVIYVGKAKSLRRRLGSYFQPSRRQTADPKLRSLIHSISEYELLPVRSEAEALLLESRLIKEYAPHYNIDWRDDKRFLLLKLDPNETYPRLTLTRLKQDDDCLYFGPFPYAGVLRDLLRYLNHSFGLRTCRVREPDGATFHHCLKHAIRACSGPCVGRVTAEEYARRVQQAVSVLRGETRQALDDLQTRMEAAAGRQQYETAAKLRDMMANIRALCDPSRRSFGRARLPSAGGNDGVVALQQALGLQHAPGCIECFDVSNLGGALAVASLVCFRNGRPSPKDYRRFRIRTVAGADDFAMIREAVSRRYQRVVSESATPPDLVVVDGGMGQLNAAVEGLAAASGLALPALGLAKKEEGIYLPGRNEPLILPRHHAGLRLLQAVRDEAHRFALTYHRQLRRRRLADSVLLDIEGIGRQRVRQLLSRFGSVRGLAQVTPEEVAAAVPGIGMVLAQRVCEVAQRAARQPANEA